MTKSFEEYDEEYKGHLDRIRSFLAAGSRSRTTLAECDKLLLEARSCATAMVALAEVEGNGLRVMESKQRLERDLGPLTKEVQRQLDSMNRQELFAQPMEMEPGGRNNDMDRLIQNSDDLLRESLALCNDTEYTGNSTLLQMGQQREQLETTQDHINATLEAMTQASLVLKQMGRKAFKNRLFLQCFTLFMAILDLYVLVHLFRRGHKSN